MGKKKNEPSPSMSAEDYKYVYETGGDVLVELFTTPTCHYCKDVKAFLDKHKIDYIVYDVTKDQEARRRLIEVYGERGVPLLIFGDTKIIGYNEEQLKKAFDIK